MRHWTPWTRTKKKAWREKATSDGSTLIIYQNQMNFEEKYRSSSLIMTEITHAVINAVKAKASDVQNLEFETEPLHTKFSIMKKPFNMESTSWACSLASIDHRRRLTTQRSKPTRQPVMRYLIRWTFNFKILFDFRRKSFRFKFAYISKVAKRIPKILIKGSKSYFFVFYFSFRLINKCNRWIGLLYNIPYNC